MGFTFDQKCSWIFQMKTLKACLNTINPLKYISHSCLRCNFKLQPQLFKSLICSQLDYGTPIYNQSNESTLILPNTHLSSALRMARGVLVLFSAFCVEAAKPPLILSADFLTSSSRFPELPIQSTPSFHNILLHSLTCHLQYLLILNSLLPIISTIPP